MPLRCRLLGSLPEELGHGGLVLDQLEQGVAQVGERFGQAIYARAFAWIRAHREGERFQAVRLYALTDLRDALLELVEDKAAVAELFRQ